MTEEVTLVSSANATSLDWKSACMNIMHTLRKNAKLITDQFIILRLMDICRKQTER